MIRITSKIDGFRRAGVAHPATPTDHADDVFTKAQLALLESETMLVVEHLADDAEVKKLAAKKAGAA